MGGCVGGCSSYGPVLPQKLGSEAGKEGRVLPVASVSPGSHSQHQSQPCGKMLLRRGDSSQEAASLCFPGVRDPIY